MAFRHDASSFDPRQCLRAQQGHVRVYQPETILFLNMFGAAAADALFLNNITYGESVLYGHLVFAKTQEQR